MQRGILMLQQFWGGLGGGIIGVFLYAFYDSIFLKYDLFGGIAWSIVYGYVGGFVGVAVVGYIYLKKISNLQHFLKSLIISFIGLGVVLGIFFLIFFCGAIIQNAIAINILLTAFPPVVVIGGFQLGLKSEQNH